MQRDLPLDTLAWLLWSCVVCPVEWLCRGPARVNRAIGEAMLAEVFSSADEATDRRWTNRCLRTVYRRARRSSGSTRP
jgi:hypothetical protein